MNIKIILEPSEEGGYTAIVPALPGCISEGDTREEVLSNQSLHQISRKMRLPGELSVGRKKAYNDLIATRRER